LYGIDVELSLVDLLKTLQTVLRLPRIRLSSIEPKYMSTDLIRCLKDLPFCRHFHIPLQSADNTVLERMQRGYTVDHLEQIVEMISSAFSDCAIGGDVIVGFPGECKKEFQSTYSFIETHPLTHLHVFPYSVRPGTVASAFGDPVPHEEKKRRLWLLRALIKEKNYEFRKSLHGKTLSIIVEKDAGVTSGITDNYIRIELGDEYPDRTLQAVMITDVTEDKTFAAVVQT
jgi:threonylcarbamoyladenosine tRNA methylthiotransferase MtaB